MLGFLARGRFHGKPTYYVSRWLFLRLLAVVFLIAFVSLWVQIDGLIGSSGILPAEGFLDLLEGRLGADAYLRVPTLCWLASSDLALHLLCAAGALLSVLLLVGVAPLVVLFLLWAIYLSLVLVGQTFLSFHW